MCVCVHRVCVNECVSEITVRLYRYKPLLPCMVDEYCTRGSSGGGGSTISQVNVRSHHWFDDIVYGNFDFGH